ncbi:uncharacterized protein CFAP92 isoform X2 [Struthio camelus]|uniref:uncharacterized protein CFAP92 isoform X2 n=2 Tax=Struthio camelus TaxID=8801 RepID=UPI003603BBD2
MAKQEHGTSETVDEEEMEEEMTDLDAMCSKSTFETESLEVLEGGGHLTPESKSSKSFLSEEGSIGASHTVTCTFTVSLAVPIVVSRHKRKTSDVAEVQRNCIQGDNHGAIPRMRRYYHIEYFLLPDDISPRKLDLVLFGTVAKLFAESDSKTIIPWFENDQIWMSWNHSININVTNEYLIKLRDHKITLKLWDSKDKVSSKAQFSQPKIFSSQVENADAAGGVKYTVLLQRKFFEETQPPPSCTKVKGAMESKAQKESSARLVKAKETYLSKLPTSNYGLPHPSRTDDLCTASVPFANNRFLNEVQLVKQKAVADPPGDTTSEKPEKTKDDLGSLTYQADKTVTASGRRASGPKKVIAAGNKRLLSHVKLPNAQTMLVAMAKKHGSTSLQLALMPLLAGEKSVISRLEENNPKVLDAYMTFTVETPLLSERQRHELNPLIIKIRSATCLPNTPVPIEVLQKLCVPTYCKYKFHSFPVHQTHGQIHGTHVYFKDVNVLLTGTMKPEELKGYLRGPPMEIEVHDRDRNMANNTQKPCLFGEDQADEKVGEVSLLACKSTIYNSFTKNKAWHPHGIAKVSLADLLLGKKCLNISVPIHSCSAPNAAACKEEEKNERIVGSVDSFSLLPMGHYLESDSILKVRVEIAIPLGLQAETADTEVTNYPYGCIIYIFDYNNASLLHDLMEEITEINAEALRLDCYPVELIQMALATLKLKTTHKHQKVSELDIVTGFHVLDGAIHLFVLEGLKDKAIKRLWDRHFERTNRPEDGRLEILYNSHLSFHQRLYIDLEAILYHFRLCKPLFTITKQPLLYVRGMVPWACFQALSRLSYLCHSKRLRDVVHGDLLPSAEMITVLSQEFGIPLTKEDLFTQKPPSVSFSSDSYTKPAKVSSVKPAVYSSLDNYNEKYMQWKKEIEDKISSERNHIEANIAAVSQLKGKMKNPKFEAFRIFPVDGKSVYNYSSQSLNSTELAKKRLRQEMATEPKKRFTYCREYLSAMLDPVDLVAAYKESLAKSKSMWLSPDGFVFPGYKSSIESNLHPQMPDKARLKELSEKWQENVLFGNMDPVLPRDRWSWDKRHIDFDLYKKPPELCMATVLQRDATQVLQTAFDDTKLKVHRCSTAAELRARGPRAAFQLQKLQGLLKDKPLKFSLRKPGLILKPMPALSVLDSQPCDNSSDVLGKRKSITCGFVPGASDQHSLKWNKNIIPCHNREHEKFEKLKGADFKLLCYNHSFIYKRERSARGGHSNILAQQQDPPQNDTMEPTVILDAATGSQHWDVPLTEN